MVLGMCPLSGQRYTTPENELDLTKGTHSTRPIKINLPLVDFKYPAIANRIDSFIQNSQPDSPSQVIALFEDSTIYVTDEPRELTDVYIHYKLPYTNKKDLNYIGYITTKYGNLAVVLPPKNFINWITIDSTAILTTRITFSRIAEGFAQERNFINIADLLPKSHIYILESWS